MLAFAIVVYIGIVVDSQALIGAGWIAHGFWDAIHHEATGQPMSRPGTRRFAPDNQLQTSTSMPRRAVVG
jgi:hypothetical protein